MFHNEDASLQKIRAREIISHLRVLYPNAKCHLSYRTPLELLIGCILSAQCADERVNQVTPALFAKYKNASDFARADQAELESEIYSTGFFRNKARSIISCSRTLAESYGGEIPRTMEGLTLLSGVGRKTANVILANAYAIPGVIVDTHIKRLAARLGLTAKSDPEKIEFDLMEIVPKEEWTYFSNALGDHGREICKARKPMCGECRISPLCPSRES
ncbi:MAG: endonuclease III [Deltaproteobacteria bacterium]